jgi:hypothetical protein
MIQLFLFIVCPKKNYSTAMKLSIMDDDYCCSGGMCNKESSNNSTAKTRTKSKKSIYEFFKHVKNLYAAELSLLQ